MKGILQKMLTELGNEVQYKMLLGETELPLNQYIGKEVEINYLNKIICLGCGKETYKSFFQGYCYPCFTTLPETDDCILKPELCRAHEGVARNMEWAESHCLQTHYVYLAVSSDLKVGVTRSTQIPTRWIDQGAGRGLIIAETPNRYTAGLIEVTLKNHFADKTNWQKMLKADAPQNIVLEEERSKIHALLPTELQQFFTSKYTQINIKYPLLKYPKKVKSVSFDKVTNLKGILTGIKGQYLIFDNENVFNVRKHGGYLVEIKVNNQSSLML